MQQVQATSPYPYYYYMPVQMEGDQQQGVPMAAFAVETPQPEIVQPKEETKKEVKECDAEDQKKKRKPKFKKLSGCQKFFVVIGVLAFIGFFVKLLGVGIGLTVISHMYRSCENPPHHLERQWATDPSIASNIRLDITSAMVHVRTCPHAKSITIHTSSRSKNPEDLNRMIPTYKVMDGSIILTAKFPAFDFDSCASVKVDVVVPESLANPANLFVTTETGVVYVLPNKHHKEHHEEHHHGFKNTTSRPEIFNNIDISTKAGHVEVAHVHTRGTISVFSKVGGVTLKDVTATFLTGSTITGFVNVEHVRVGQLTAIADSGSVTVNGVVFEEKINLDTYFLQASIDIGNLEVKRIWNKLNAEHTAVVSVNSGSGRSEVKLSKKANLKFAVSTVSGDIELHGKDLPKLIEDTEISKTGRIEGQGALTDVTIATSSGRAHVGFRECKRHHDKKHDNKDDEKPKEETTDADPSETTTEHDKPKIHPHHTKPHKTNQPVTGGKHQERPHRTHA